MINDPAKVLESGASAWSSAIWFWMTPHEYGGWCMPVARWPAFASCNTTCYDGPSGCSDSACTNDHWLPRKVDNCHDAMVGSGTGMGQVIAIINGGYNCCKISNYAGSTRSRMGTYIATYKAWTGDVPRSDLSSIVAPNCPLANGMSCNEWGSCR